MHLQILIGFGATLWWSRDPLWPPRWEAPAATAAAIAGGVAITLGLARLAAVRLGRLADREDLADTWRRVHRTQTTLFWLCLPVFIGQLLLTDWMATLQNAPTLADIPGAASLLTLSPLLICLVGVLWIIYPVDRAMRDRLDRASFDSAARPAWSRTGYVVFHVRHQMLMILVPLMIVLIAYDAARPFDDLVRDRLGFPWFSDVVLGLAAACTFVIAPLLLRHIWTTEALPPGRLRDELQNLCDRIGLACREILVWKSNHTVVNAAVMGVLDRVRYVVLSDGLLRSLDSRKVEAVFGHEAGHVKHRHIPYFLLFAFASMLATSGLMELLYRCWRPESMSQATHESIIQVVGLSMVVACWAIGFGFISRRFERQADLFGARCISPSDERDCVLPCVPHDPHASPEAKQHGLCATGAKVFIDALEDVAALNGVSREEFSWRHASIADRVDFLTKTAADPRALFNFQRSIRRIKRVLLFGCLGGSAFSIWYLWPIVTKLLGSTATS